MERVRRIEIDGVMILRQDFSNTDPESLIPLLEQSAKMIRTERSHPLLALTDMTGVRYSSELNDALKAFVRGNKPYILSSAVIGLDWLKPIVNMFNNLTGRRIRAFDDEQEAVRWLVEQGRCAADE